MANTRPTKMMALERDNIEKTAFSDVITTSSDDDFDKIDGIDNVEAGKLPEVCLQALAMAPTLRSIQVHDSLSNLCRT